MTLTLQTPKIEYTGDGVQTLFPFTFTVQDDSEVVVTIDEAPQVENSDYTIENLTPAGGEVLFVVAPADQTKVLIVRKTPITQQIDYEPFDAFPAETHEFGLDKLTAIIQEVLGGVQVPSTSPVQSVFGRIGHVIALLGDYTASLITYVNAFSGLTATNVQDAIDELKTIGDTHEGDTGNPHQVMHNQLTDVSADQHHPQIHNHDGLDGSGTVAHDDITGVTKDQHHPQNHNHDGSADNQKIDHFNLLNIGINTHAQIDTHIADVDNPHDTTFLNLADTDDTDYVDKRLHLPTVNDAEAGLELKYSLEDVLGEAFPTGLYDGGELNIVNGGLNVEIIQGEGVILDSYTNPLLVPTRVNLSWPTQDEPIVAPNAIGIVHLTIVDSGSQAGAPLVNTNLGILTQYPVGVEPTPAQKRDQIYIGFIINNSAEWGEVSSPTTVNNTAHNYTELVTDVLGKSTIEQGGAVREAAGFTLDQDEGTIWELSRNWHVNRKDPNREAFAARPNFQWRYVNRDFTDVSALTGVADPTQWDNNGTVSTIGGSGNQATIQPVYLDPRDNFWVMWGQRVYDNYIDAAVNIGANAAEMIVPNFLSGDCILLGYIVAEKGKNDWDEDEARFIAVVAHQSGGTASTVTTFLQLLDTPSDYIGDALKVLRVDAGEAFVEFHTLLHDDLGGVTADQHHNQLHLLYGTDHDDVDSDPVAAIKHVLHRNLDNLKWEVDYRSKFFEPYTDGNTYYPQEMVFVDGWLMSANKVTTDYPAPVPVGVAQYLYAGATPTAQTTAKQIIFGNRYTWSISGYLGGYRVNTVSGNQYIVYSVIDPLGTPIVTQVASFNSTVTGWVELAVPPALVLSGTVIDLVAVVSEPDPSPTTWNGNWDYDTPNNAGTPASGVMQHADKAKDQLRVHKTDNDGGDRSAELLALSNGDIVDSGSIRWSIQDVADTGTYVTLTVAPATQITPDGVKNFIFETVVATPITRMEDLNYWTTNGNGQIQGLYIEDDSYTNIVPNGNAYGTDIYITEAELSPDWDVMGFPAGVVGSGGGEFVPDLFTGAGSSGYVPDPISETGKVMFDDSSWKRIDYVTDIDNKPAASVSHWTLNGNDIYNNNSGNVGIGMASALAKLHVALSGIGVNLHATVGQLAVMHIRDNDPTLLIQDQATGTSQVNSTLRLAESGGGGTLDNFMDVSFRGSEQITGATSYGLNVNSKGNPLGSFLFVSAVNGNVGINQPNALARLHVRFDFSGAPAVASRVTAMFERNTESIVQISTSSIGKSSLYFGNTVDAGAGRIVYDHSNDSMALSTATTERMRIDSAGIVEVASPAAGAAVAGSVNALNGFYENGVKIGGGAAYTEGSWTPKIWQLNSTQKGSPIYTTQSGRWSRIGNLVTLEFRLVVNENSANTTQVWTIGDTPFDFIDDDSYGSLGLYLNGLFAGPDNQLANLQGNAGFNQIVIAFSFDRGTSTVVNYPTYNNIKGVSITVAGSITYRTNDP